MVAFDKPATFRAVMKSLVVEPPAAMSKKIPTTVRTVDVVKALWTR